MALPPLSLSPYDREKKRRRKKGKKTSAVLAFPSIFRSVPGNPKKRRGRRGEDRGHPGTMRLRTSKAPTYTLRQVRQGSIRKEDQKKEEKEEKEEEMLECRELDRRWECGGRGKGGKLETRERVASLARSKTRKTKKKKP